MLADLRLPPDTASLEPCDDSLTAWAVESIRNRLLRRRRERSPAAGGHRSRILGALRRLQNPQLSGFHAPHGTVLLSEPFNGIPGSISKGPNDRTSALVGSMLGRAPAVALVQVLAGFGSAALERVAAVGTRIAIIPAGKRFCDVSPSVGRAVPDIDSWPAPPSGLFVVDERRMLLRSSALRMTAAHEFAHALDASLAKRPRSYFSFESEELRYYFATATGYINEYAATGLDEYFAESVRAYVEINDPRCAWLPLTRQDLFLRDPRMFALIDRLFKTNLTMTERRSRERYVRAKRA